MKLHFKKPIVVVRDRNSINGYTTIWSDVTTVIEQLLENANSNTLEDINNAIATFNQANMTSFTIDDFAAVVYSNDTL
jgi:hypothetical protein